MADKNFKVKNALELGTASIITSSGTLSLPNATDTIIGRNTTDTLANKTILSAEEIITISETSATGTVDLDVITQSILYFTSNASGNWTLNIRGNSSTSLNSILPVGSIITIVFMVTQGSTAFYQTGFQIDGSSHTPKWQGGSAPTEGNASGIDIYSFSITKTDANPTYLTIGTLAGFA